MMKITIRFLTVLLLLQTVVYLIGNCKMLFISWNMKQASFKRLMKILINLQKLFKIRHALSLRLYRSSDRKSTRLNSSHVAISYAVFCLKKKNNTTHQAGAPNKYTSSENRDKLE